MWGPACPRPAVSDVLVFASRLAPQSGSVRLHLRYLQLHVASCFLLSVYFRVFPWPLQLSVQTHHMTVRTAHPTYNTKHMFYLLLFTFRGFRGHHEKRIGVRLPSILDQTVDSLSDFP